tara:strand:+ start:425 stop:574 length:150 start_codon:yes stop_codon:yes gene_type:complete
MFYKIYAKKPEETVLQRLPIGRLNKGSVTRALIDKALSTVNKIGLTKVL